MFSISRCSSLSQRLAYTGTTSRTRFTSNLYAPNGESKQAQLTNILEEAVKEAPKPRPAPVASDMYNHTASMTPTVEWEAFTSYDSTWIKPHHFSYKARTVAPYRPPARLLVAPSSASAKKDDIFYQLDIDPRKEILNAPLLSSFVSEMGRIHNRCYTKLTSKSQRRLGKAIRRAKMMGIIPRLRNMRVKYTFQNNRTSM